MTTINNKINLETIKLSFNLIKWTNIVGHFKIV